LVFLLAPTTLGAGSDREVAERPETKGRYGNEDA
jgi:hypothetical protein